jgi:hypothetical protein
MRSGSPEIVIKIPPLGINRTQIFVSRLKFKSIYVEKIYVLTCCGAYIQVIRVVSSIQTLLPTFCIHAVVVLPVSPSLM